jgi:transcriptional regulator with GAF, ATPase, and Fis domain
MPGAAHASLHGPPSADDHGTAEVADLAGQLGALARSLEALDDTATMLDEVVATAVRLIPGVQQASLSVVTSRRHVSPQHASGELPRTVDALQTETGEGPCLDAVDEHRTVRVPDMGHEQRWPAFARRAYEAGAGSMLSFQLYVEGDNLGALNLYSREPHAFDDESEQVGLLFASHAAVAFAGAQKVDHLHRALDSRDQIGQAKGILMERYHVDADQAFRMLVRLSSAHERKLHDVADELTRTRLLPA